MQISANVHKSMVTIILIYNLFEHKHLSRRRKKNSEKVKLQYNHELNTSAAIAMHNKTKACMYLTSYMGVCHKPYELAETDKELLSSKNQK